MYQYTSNKLLVFQVQFNNGLLYSLDIINVNTEDSTQDSRLSVIFKFYKTNYSVILEIILRLTAKLFIVVAKVKSQDYHYLIVHSGKYCHIQTRDSGSLAIAIAIEWKREFITPQLCFQRFGQLFTRIQHLSCDIIGCDVQYDDHNLRRPTQLSGKDHCILATNLRVNQPQSQAQMSG